MEFCASAVLPFADADSVEGEVLDTRTRIARIQRSARRAAGRMTRRAGAWNNLRPLFDDFESRAGGALDWSYYPENPASSHLRPLHREMGIYGMGCMLVDPEFMIRWNVQLAYSFFSDLLGSPHYCRGLHCGSTLDWSQLP